VSALGFQKSRTLSEARAFQVADASKTKPSNATRKFCREQQPKFCTNNFPHDRRAEDLDGQFPCGKYFKKFGFGVFK
jgi:hypothetical protein